MEHDITFFYNITRDTSDCLIVFRNPYRNFNHKIEYKSHLFLFEPV